MLKRIFDILAAACGLLLLSPVILIVAWQVRRKLGSPVFFRQTRPGKDGKPFKMIKFRTMRDAVDKQGNPLPDSERITPFGRFLRSTSLDELPELWNVLKGEMSIVGPRPLLMEYMDYYTEEEMLRHSVRPGVTGLAQVTGRNALTWEQKLGLDVEYVQKQSLLFDLKIILTTIKKVFKREDILDAAPQGSLSSYRAKHKAEREQDGG
ncbi:sugar transferase [Halomonas hibernica]|uniref:sugar transferase n=1 Tax=Halomonas hibernica TaxID=2591147 RepID=UPI0015516D83|nr:sugar transferase [Halomonas hibernica]